MKQNFCLFLSRFWSGHLNLIVQMRNHLQSTLRQHMICTFMTGNIQRPHQGKEERLNIFIEEADTLIMQSIKNTFFYFTYLLSFVIYRLG